MEKIFGSREVCNVLNISSTTLWRYIRRGTIPPPKKFLPNGRNGWTKSQIEGVLAARRVADVYRDPAEKHGK
jgi:predicted DNA-binding transcriptional regulator AlpA